MMKPRVAELVAMTVVMVVGMLPSATLALDPPPLSPVELTNAERLELRFDPEAIERRNQRSLEQGDPVSPGFSMIDGRYEPELFFAWELFNELISRAYASDPQARVAFRAQIEENLVAVEGLGFPEDLWLRLERSAGGFLESRLAQQSLADELPRASTRELADLRSRIEQLQRGECRTRHRAMRAVAAELGESMFHRLLYLGVAPNTLLLESVEDDRAAVLVFVAEGCP